jgi:hypothetical protein
MQKYPFAGARVIAQRFLTTVPMTKDILHRELGMRQLSRRWAPHFLSPAQKVARVEASQTILRVPENAESNDFEGIAMGDESWYRYCYSSLIMLAGAIRGYSKDAANNWLEKNNNNDCLYCTSMNPVVCTTKRKQI